MQVQVNSDNATKFGATTIADVETRVRERLDRFSSRLTRVEVHLRDQDGTASRGEDGMEAMIEVRPSGQQPLAVSHKAVQAADAIAGALSKMVARLETVFGKEQRAT
jgi:hypothetical protein